MKIYFTASTVGMKNYSESYKRIVNHLKKARHEVRYKHVLEGAASMRTVRPVKERVNVQKKLERWITDSDCMIVEGSYPSISVGYEIYLALRLGKPILLIYREGSDTPSIFDDSDNEKLIMESYTDKNLNQRLDEFLEFAANKNESRFTFFITSEIATYLDEIASKNKLPKSVYLRQLIEQDMKKK